MSTLYIQVHRHPRLLHAEPSNFPCLSAVVQPHNLISKKRTNRSLQQSLTRLPLQLPVFVRTLGSPGHLGREPLCVIRHGDQNKVSDGPTWEQWTRGHELRVEVRLVEIGSLKIGCRSST